MNPTIEKLATLTIAPAAPPKAPTIKYDLMSLFQRDGRPDAVLSITDAKKIAPETTYMIYGKGMDDALAIEKLVPQFAYGSVLLIFDFPAEEYAAFDARVRKHDFCAWDKFGDDQYGRAWVKSHYDGGTFATHLTYLLEMVKRTTGPVLELGAGEGSTPALHLAVEDRLLVTIDNNEEWLKRYEGLASKTHVLECLPDPAASEWLSKKWSVVFIDHSPGESRGWAIEKVRPNSEFLVVHDTEELGYGIEDLLSSFKYRKDFKYARPWTTIVSDTKEIGDVVAGVAPSVAKEYEEPANVQDRP